MAKENNATEAKVTLGGWYQRTTLHLSEVYELFISGRSDLNLSKPELAKHHKRLDIAEVSREQGYFELVRARTKSGIEIRYFEDGLYVLEMQSGDVAHAQKALQRYFDEALSPAISFIFSLGAPTPKILANMKTVHPTVVAAVHPNPAAYRVDEKTFGAVYQKMLAKDVAMYKTRFHIFVVAKAAFASKITPLVEMQIFFREFKDQLEKYLNIHRNLWEEISAIKERKSVRGSEVEQLRAKLDQYEKTINLITNRINQMGAYVRTRSAISKKLEIETHLTDLFQFKFEALSDTLEYIKELWKMTVAYLNSAIQNLVEIKNQGASRGIQSLQLITSLGVVSAILGYLSKNELPMLTAWGLAYFAVIVVVTWCVNYTITRIYAAKKYGLKFGERAAEV